jgi:hypothetical protein
MAQRSLSPENTPLIQQPGPQLKTVAELHRMCVSAAPSERRTKLWEGFAALYNRMIDAGLSGLELWVDGSFLTEKPAPRDVDCALWLPQSHVDNCTDQQYHELQQLGDKQAISRKYQVDLYLIPPEAQNNLIYWEALFSMTKDASGTKGFAKLYL